MRRAVGLPAEAGLLVREVEPDGPAAAAGLRTGDVLRVRSIAALRAVDGVVVLDVVRGVDRVEVRVEV